MSSQRRRTMMGFVSVTLAAAATALVTPSACATPTISITPPPYSSISADGSYTAGCLHQFILRGLDPQLAGKAEVVFSDNGAMLGSAIIENQFTGQTRTDTVSQYQWIPTTVGKHVLVAQAPGVAAVTTTVSVGEGHPFAFSSGGECQTFAS